MTVKAGHAPSIAFPITPKEKKISPDSDSVSGDITSPNEKEYQLTKKEKIDQDYLKNRDPMKEFFQLTCQAIKLNSPHMNLIAQFNTDELYSRCE